MKETYSTSRISELIPPYLNEGEAVALGEVKAVGLMWDGTFEQAGKGEIVPLQDRMVDRISEVPHVVNADTVMGVSYVRKDGFTIYLCVEVSEFGELPEGMHQVTLPSYEYAYSRKSKDETVDDAHKRLHKFMKKNQYKELKDHSIIIEIYPANPNGCTLGTPFDMGLYVPIKKL